MSNASNKPSQTNKAMVVGALLGGTASAASHWQEHQRGEIDTNEMVTKVSTDALKAGLVSGGATFVAEKMAGRPALSMLTILSAGAAGLYLMEQYRGKQQDE